MPEPYEKNLSDLYKEFGMSQYMTLNALSELVHDSLAIEHYPQFSAWCREYGEGRSLELLRQIFVDMKRNRRKLKRYVGQ